MLGRLKASRFSQAALKVNMQFYFSINFPNIKIKLFQENLSK